MMKAALLLVVCSLFAGCGDAPLSPAPLQNGPYLPQRACRAELSPPESPRGYVLVCQ